MDHELLKTFLGSGGITVAVVAGFTLISNLVKNRREGTRAEDMDDAEWNAAYKAAAEQHVLGYDVPMRQAMLDVRQIVNSLERGAGKEPTKFDPLPEPDKYPLFPKRGGDKNQ